MKPGISVYSLIRSLRSGRLTHEGILRLFSENGVKYAELLDDFFNDDVRETSRPYTKALLEELALQVSSYSISNDFLHCSDVNEEISRVRTGIDRALYFGTSNVRVFSANLKGDISYDDCRRVIIDAFKECVKYAEEKNVSLNLENHGKMAGKSSQVREIIEAVGSRFLRANADTGNFMLVSEEPLSAIENLLDYMGFVHFKDFKADVNGRYKGLDGRQYAGTVIGEGEVPLRAILDSLRNSGYTGHLSIEYEGSGDDIEETLKSYKYLLKEATV